MSSFHGEGRGGQGGGPPRAPNALRPEDVPDKPVSLRRIGTSVRALPRAAGAAAGADRVRLDPQRRLAVPAARSGRQGDRRARPRTADVDGGGHDRAGDRQRRDRRRADVDLQPGRAARDARPARRRVRAPAADVAGVLHAHALGRGAGADRLRHRRDRRRRHEHRDLDRLHGRHRPRDGRRDVRALLAADPVLADPAAVLRVADAARGQRAPADPVGAPGPPRRHVHAGRGVAVGVGHPARQNDGSLRRARRSLLLGVLASSPTSRCARGWRGAGGWPRCR